MDGSGSNSYLTINNMKTLLFAILLLATFSCSEDEKIAQEIVYESLEGDWVISGSMTGEFTLVQVGSDLVVDHGFYDVDGYHFDITVKRAVEILQDYKITIYLIADLENNLAFRDCSQDLIHFKSIGPQTGDCYIANAFYESYTGIEITR